MGRAGSALEPSISIFVSLPPWFLSQSLDLSSPKTNRRAHPLHYRRPQPVLWPPPLVEAAPPCLGLLCHLPAAVALAPARRRHPEFLRAAASPSVSQPPPLTIASRAAVLPSRARPPPRRAPPPPQAAARRPREGQGPAGVKKEAKEEGQLQGNRGRGRATRFKEEEEEKKGRRRRKVEEEEEEEFRGWTKIPIKVFYDDIQRGQGVDTHTMHHNTLTTK